MLVAGAGGFAKQVLEILSQQGETDIVFYDDLHTNGPELLFERFRILKNMDAAKEYFQTDDRFVLGVGGPLVRKKMHDLLTNCGGTIVSAISRSSEKGSFGTKILPGATIMQQAVITTNVKIGVGVLVNMHCTIGHDCVIGDFCELSAGSRISGNCIVGNFCAVGTNAVLLPGIQLCDNVIVGASALVTKNITEAGTYMGIPAKRIK